MTTDAPTHQMILERLGPGRWRVPTGEEWRNPSGGLWGGYAIGLATRIIEAEPERVGEVLSLTLTYAAALPAGDLDVRTRRIRQGGSVGVSTVLERRTLDGFPPKPSAGSRSLAWVRSRREPLDRALLGMITDNSPPRAMYAFGMGVSTTTLSLTVYLHATEAEVAEVGNDFILVEYEGRIGGGGASDERSSYWRRDGKLLATSEQLVWYRKVPPRSPE